MDNNNKGAQLKNFRGYTIIQQLRVVAGESDIYVVEKEAANYILKLYRFGITPKDEILNKIKDLSHRFPENIIKIYECGSDEDLERYYEIQEFVQFGSLINILSSVNDTKRHTLAKMIARQVNAGLKVLHDNNILHLDLKPSNILIRSIKPVNLILTDFGLASIIDPELSKKMTSVKGTNIYQAPETYTGGMHRYSDYWSLGIIIYEVLLGCNPFNKISPSEIMYKITTKGIEIPEIIVGDHKMLLRGLLNKDPNNRWGYDQVQKWLEGEIEDENFEENDEKYQKPYKFRKKEYFSLKDLAASFIESYESWEDSKLHMNEGYISDWLKGNDDFDNAVNIKKIIKSYSDNDNLALIKIIYTYNDELPFIFSGYRISFIDLYCLIERHIKKESSKTDEAVIGYLTNGELFKYYKIFLEARESKEDSLAIFLDHFAKTMSNLPSDNFMTELEAKLNILKIINGPENYFIPHDMSIDDEKKIDFIIKNHENIIEKSKFESWIRKYVVSMKMKLEFLSNSSKYTEIIDLFNRRDLLTVEEYDQLSKLLCPSDLTLNLSDDSSEIFIIKSMKLKEYLYNNVFITAAEFEALTGKYIIDEMIERIDISNIDQYKKTIETLRSGDLLTRNEIDEINNDYVMLKSIMFDLENDNAETFFEKSKKIKSLYSKGVLISKKEFREVHDRYKNIQKEIVGLIKKDLEKASKLIKTLYLAEHENIDLNGLLSIALAEGDIETIKLLIVAGANIDLKDENGETLLMKAIGSGNIVLFKILIETGADVNARNNYGYTALMWAVDSGNREAVFSLLKAGADVNAWDGNGYGALMGSVLHGGDEILTVLIEAGVEINSKDKSGMSALMLAVIKGKDKAVKILIDHGADTGVKDENGHNILIRSFIEGNERLSKMLRDIGIEIDQRNKDLVTPLIQASFDGNFKLANKLIEFGADVNARNKYNWTPLMCAAFKGHSEIVKVLIDNDKTDINIMDRDDTTALMLAVVEDHIEIVKLLLGKNVEINAEDKDGNSALAHSVINNRIKISGLLISAGADINVIDHNGNSILLRFLLAGKTQNAQKIIEAGADINIQNKKGMTALGIVLEKGYEEIFWKLTGANVDLNICDTNGNTPLMLYSKAGRADVVSKLIKAGANLNCNNANYRTAVMLSVINGHDTILKMLIDAGATTNYRDDEDNTALMKAFEKGKESVIKILIEGGADINARDDDGNTLLLRLLLTGKIQNAKKLIDAGADIRMQNRKGITALDVVLEKGYEEIFRKLIEAHIDLNIYDQHGNTPLMRYSEAGRADVVSKLIKAGADIKIKTKQGKTLLADAIDKKNHLVIKALCDAGADTEEMDRNQYTLLMNAAIAGDLETVKILCEAGANINAKDENFNTVRMRAVIEGRVEVANYLREARRSPSNNSASKKTAEKSELTMENQQKIYYIGSDIEIEFVWIPPGIFQMGSPGIETGRNPDETLHTVEITKGFWMGKFPVTQKQWQKVMGNNPSGFINGDTSHPVEQVSWKECLDFIMKLNNILAGDDTKKHLEFRMPTEAEWEYACRAGSITKYYWGDKMYGDYCCYKENSADSTHPVGQKKPNAWGLYDMSGNVYEWCSDWYGDYPNETKTDPAGPDTGKYRVNRGGCWNADARFCRAASRDKRLAAYGYYLLGFRIVMTES